MLKFYNSINNYFYIKSGREDDCYVSQVSQEEYSVRYVPRENGTHYLHAKLGNLARSLISSFNVLRENKYYVLLILV